MANVTNTTQLSLFSLIRTAIETNSTLAVKFSDRNILQFEPKHKASGFCGFPYIVVRVPSSDTEFILLNHSDNEDTFESEISLVMEYMARDNFLTYANALIYQLEATESTFGNSGYENVKIGLRNVQEVTEDSKELVVGTFTISFTGWVGR